MHRIYKKLVNFSIKRTAGGRKPRRRFDLCRTTNGKSAQKNVTSSLPGSKLIIAEKNYENWRVLVFSFDWLQIHFSSSSSSLRRSSNNSSSLTCSTCLRSS